MWNNEGQYTRKKAKWWNTELKKAVKEKKKAGKKYVHLGAQQSIYRETHPRKGGDKNSKTEELRRLWKEETYKLNKRAFWTQIRRMGVHQRK